MLTRLNGKRFVLNADLIRSVEEVPDTSIHLTNGDRVMVRESMKEVVSRTVEYEMTLRGLIRPS
ncbi:MAG: flagellar FlbD family protein [Phycisphaerales bacterium]